MAIETETVDGESEATEIKKSWAEVVAKLNPTVSYVGVVWDDEGVHTFAHVSGTSGDRAVLALRLRKVVRDLEADALRG
jgi:hypothetical protein